MRMPQLLNVVLLILTLAAGCNKGKEPIEKKKDKDVTVIAHIEGASKAMVDPSGALGWRFDDAIDIISSEGSVVKFLSESVNGAEASFKGKLSEEESVAGGVYPSGQGEFSEGTLLLEYPSEFSWEEGVAAPPMVGKLSGENNLLFSEAGGRLRFTFSAIPSSARSFHVTASGQSLCGSFPVVNGTVTTRAAEEAEDVVVKFSQPRGSMTFHIPVPTGNYNAITVWFEDEGGNRLAWADGGLVSNPATVTRGSEISLSGGSFAPSLSVMTYNILYYKPSTEESITGFKRWEFRRDNLIARIKQANPVIIGTQENTGWQAQYILEKCPQYKILGRNLYGTDYNTLSPSNTSQMNYEIEAIYYDYSAVELVDNQWETFWLSLTPDTPRSKLEGTKYSRACTWGKFRIKGSSVVFYVFNCHLHANSGAESGYDPEEIRRSEAEIILKKIKGIAKGAPVILTGDFNSKPSASTIGYILDNTYVKVADSRPASYTGRKGTFTNFSTAASYNTDSYRYDLIFISDEWNLLQYDVIDTDVTTGDWASDHLPVVVKLANK
jgi:endonuclease/exonuclease/phosphatase family metal-dependent hydrolase